METLATQLPRANKKCKSPNALMYAYAHANLDDGTTKKTGF